jgi:hypothetical protein
MVSQSVLQFPPNLQYVQCPGCAQGKMPASAHPPSETRASAPFEHIHSDLKSFPVVSYHKYKYFISFIDDFTSYTWIIFLHDKASAITALKQFMAMANNQYNARIKGWMSDAGGEYESDAWGKNQRLTISSSTPDNLIVLRDDCKHLGLNCLSR